MVLTPLQAFHHPWTQGYCETKKRPTSS